MRPRHLSIHLCAAALLLGNATLGSAQSALYRGNDTDRATLDHHRTSIIAESRPIRDLYAASSQEGTRLTQEMLQGNWALGEHTCAEKAEMIGVESGREIFECRAGGQIIVLPDGRVRITAEDGTRIQDVRVMRYHVVIIDSEFDSEFHWRRC